ncbi:MAG: amidohydrolase family protein [Actinomycetia bacterium]|nr:amidohydrolase family protein [Actinomycetes bacterium]
MDVVDRCVGGSNGIDEAGEASDDRGDGSDECAELAAACRIAETGRSCLRMAALVISGRVATMDDASAPFDGRVWVRDGRVVDVTKGAKGKVGFSDAVVVDVGGAFVLPGFIDMHNHLAYNLLPLWSEPGRTEPWLHNKHWTGAGTYTESITEPAWVYAKAAPEALLAYVQVREMAGGATAAQGWPTANRGYGTIVRNIDSEAAGTGRDDLIFTSVVTKTGDALANRVRDMDAGAGFIYHCAEGQRGSRVLRDYTDLAADDGLLSTFIGIHCCAVDAANWQRWGQNTAGGVVWSPTSNMLLYNQTTLIPDVRSRGVRVCLGSDWGPSGTKNVLGEMKVARIMSDAFTWGLSDRDIVEMVTVNPGILLERCWNVPIGRLVPGAFADITVLRGHGRGTPWTRILAGTERDIALVVIDGTARYGDATLMTAVAAPPSFTMTVGGRRRRVALPSATDPANAWTWTDIMATLRKVQRNPQAAMTKASARASTGSRFGPTAELELFPDMPDSRLSGRAGPPKHPELVRIPTIPSIEHDAGYFRALARAPIHQGALNPLRGWFRS